jgi:hypothetical protein
MRYIFLPVFVLFLFHFTGNAQSVEEEIQELLTFQVLCENNPVFVNQAVIHQTGDENNMIVLQQNTGIASNQILSIQQEAGNNGYIEQTGDRHHTVLVQNGVSNEANLWSMGRETFTMVSQSGDNNHVNSYIYNPGLTAKSATLVQNGSNNQIDFAFPENRGIAAAYLPEIAYINQTGNDLGVTAVFDSYSPIYIEQQAGAGGGMKVVVTNSAFSFPMKKY